MYKFSPCIRAKILKPHPEGQEDLSISAFRHWRVFVRVSERELVQEYDVVSNKPLVVVSL